jgi:hypothetical protein
LGWIIGGSNIFGYGALISDVRVTFANKRTIDLVQKAYLISNFLAAGFTGSVRVGFMLLDSLMHFTYLTPSLRKTGSWDPLLIADNWYPIAKDVFESAPREEREVGSQFIIASASPTEDATLGAEIYIIRLSWPDVKAGVMINKIKICSIGSGTDVEEYKQVLQPLFDMRPNTLQDEEGNTRDWSQVLASSITRIVNHTPMLGIRKHLYIHVIRRGALYEFTNDERISRLNGSFSELAMPKVAKSYPTFMEMANKISIDAKCAVC